jgi:hypothetical protein
MSVNIKYLHLQRTSVATAAAAAAAAAAVRQTTIAALQLWRIIYATSQFHIVRHCPVDIRH